MRPGSIGSTYQLLNSEDKKLYRKCRAKIRNKFTPLYLIIVVIATFLSFMILGAMKTDTTNLIVQIGLLLPILVGAYILTSITYPRTWSLFCQEKSIIVENGGVKGIKIAIEQYIAREDEYYSESDPVNPPIWDSWQNQYREEYICKNCNEKITLKGNICNNCGEITPICSICFGNLEPNENIAIIMCCGSYVHRDHIESWMRSNKVCPHCQNNYPDIRKVKSGT